jgi:hypothetical protein
MIRLARRALLVVALLLLSTVFLVAGCTLPVQLGPLPTTGDDAATLIIIRPARFVAGGTQAVIAVDDVPVAALGNDEHVVLRVAPGARIVGVGYNSPLFGRPTSSDDYQATTIDAAARTTQYLRLEPNVGMATLNPMTPPAAQALLATTRRVTGRPASQ